PRDFDAVHDLARSRVIFGAGERNDARRVEGISRLVCDNTKVLGGRTPGGQVEVMIEKLAEDIDIVGKELLVDRVDVLGRVVRVGLIGDGITDVAGAGPVSACRGADAIGVRGSSDADEIGVRLAKSWKEWVVTVARDGPKAAEQAAVFQGLEPGPNAEAPAGRLWSLAHESLAPTAHHDEILSEKRNGAAPAQTTRGVTRAR